MRKKGYAVYNCIPYSTIKKLTQSAKNAINYASEAAIELSGDSYIESPHLLLGLLHIPALADIFERRRLTYDIVKSKMPSAVKDPPEKTIPRIQKVFQCSSDLADNIGSTDIREEHLLLSILQCDYNFKVQDILKKNGVEAFSLYIDMMVRLSMYRNSIPSPTPTLDRYGTNLNQKVKKGELKPIVGRKKEIDRIIQILLRKEKNSPCIVGDPGIGKTAVINGLAHRIANGNVPAALKEKRLVLLDLADISFDSEENLTGREFAQILKEIKSNPNIILILDWIHVAAKDVHLANKLKSVLWQNLRIIGITVPSGYKENIEKDEIFSRCFQEIRITEPNGEEAELILKGMKSGYEAHHDVHISEGAIDSVLKLSARYLKERFLPEMAIDLLDETASKARVMGISEKARIIDVTETHVADVITDWTGIPVNKLMKEESERLLNFDNILKERVVGQEEAVDAVARAVRRGRAGLKDPKRPIGTFLFLGPTGVGKTELCKALSYALFGSDDAMIRFDMSEFMEGHSVSKFIGSPPGYVGYDEEGKLTKKVRSNHIR